MAQVAEVCPLHGICDAVASLSINSNPLFQGGVVDISSLPQQEIKLKTLRLARVKAVSIGFNHVLLPLLGVNVTLNRIGAVENP